MIVRGKLGAMTPKFLNCSGSFNYVENQILFCLDERASIGLFFASFFFLCLLVFLINIF